MRIYHLNTTLSHLAYYEFKLSLSITAFREYTACSNKAALLTTHHEQIQLPQHVFIVTVMEYTPWPDSKAIMSGK